jgi:poly-gamma-glutamate synthesis protein (capsule biosynthesis protein)
MFVATGNHNLGPMEIYDSPARGKRPIFYGLGNFFWSDVQELLPHDLYAGNRRLLAETWQHPDRATDYDLTAPLNRDAFASAYTFQSVVAEVRFDGNALSRVVLHPVELGYGERLTASGIPRLVADEAAAREIVGQVVEQTAKFGLPEMPLRYSGNRAIVEVGN